MPVAPAEYTPAQVIIVAATRLREAWQLSNIDVGEMHNAALSLILATDTKIFSQHSTCCTTSRIRTESRQPDAPAM